MRCMKLISTDEAAGRLGVSGRRVRQLIDAGALPAQKVGGGYVIDESVLKSVEIHGKPGRPPKTGVTNGNAAKITAAESSAPASAKRAAKATAKKGSK